MNEFTVITDSSCDLAPEMAEQLGIEVIPLSVTIDGATYANYLDGREIGFDKFYEMLRGGATVKTSAVNTEAFSTLFRERLERGEDVLYIGFSSGLSATCQCAEVAARSLREEFPGRKLLVVDTLAASMGQGLLVYLAVQQKLLGKTIEEVRDYLEENKLSLAHWFTVDDLHFLKRGGRISAATEIVGSMLNLKPVMHVDNEGHLINMQVVRGRKGAIRRLKDKMADTAIDPKDSIVFISHGDCLDDAQQLADMIREQLGSTDISISYVGPVIGAHSGPGTLALFFLAKER